MKLTLIFTLLFTVAINGTKALGKDTVNNGSGTAEKNILFAYNNLEKYIEICFQTEACQLTQRQYDIVSKIMNGLSVERTFRNQIIFVSEKAYPKTFIIDGMVKIAKTGNKPGTPILVNSDLLYQKNNQGFFDPLTIDQAVAIIIHELGHHYGDFTHEELDVLGVKIASIMRRLIYTTPQIPWNASVSATALNQRDGSSTADVLVYVYDEILDLTQNVKESVTCDSFNNASPVPDTYTVVGYMVHNLHWTNYPVKNETGAFAIQADLVLNCQRAGDKQVLQLKDKKLNIQFATVKTLNDINAKYRTGSLKVY